MSKAECNLVFFFFAGTDFPTTRFLRRFDLLTTIDGDCTQG